MRPSISQKLPMRFFAIALFAIGFLQVAAVKPAHAQQASTYSSNELLNAGHGFFGAASSGLASLIEKATSSYGQPNGYVLGEEASGALVGGLRYGEGHLFTKNAGDHKLTNF